MDVVTGAFSFTGRYVAARLLESGREVGTLTRWSQAESPFGNRVRALPLDFRDPAVLVAALEGAETLYVTYWIRFPDRATSFGAAVANSERLFAAAREAGVGKVVYLSVANAAADSPHPYFRGKARVEAALAASGLPHAIVRPTLVFGEGEVLVNNVAWLLRRLPVFVLPRRRCALQPVAAEDVAELCVTAAREASDSNVDAAGPDVFSFEELTRLVRAAVGSRAAIVRASGRTTLALSRALGALTRQTLVTADELQALEDGLLTSDELPRGTRRLADWLEASAPWLGLELATGERRPWPEGPSPPM